MSTALENKELTFVDFLIYVGRHKLLLLFTTLIGLVCSMLAIYTTPKTFTAETTFSVQPLLGNLLNISKSLNDLSDILPHNEKYIGLLRSSFILASLIEKYDLKNHYKYDLKNYHNVVSTNDIEAHLIKKTKVTEQSKSYIRIEVNDRDPRMAADLANAYVTELQVLLSLNQPAKKILEPKQTTNLSSSKKLLNSSQTKFDNTEKDYITYLVQPIQIARPSLKPVETHMEKTLVIGIVMGFLAGILIIMIRLASSQISSDQLKQLRKAWQIKRND